MTVRVNRLPPLRWTSGRVVTGACSISEPTRAVRCPRICGTPCAVDATGAGCLSHHGPHFLRGAGEARPDRGFALGLGDPRPDRVDQDTQLALRSGMAGSIAV